MGKSVRRGGSAVRPEDPFEEGLVAEREGESGERVV